MHTSGSPEKQAKRFYVSGQVQGVGYRYFVQQVAERLGLMGYVRNLRDGRVEVYAIGTPSQIRALLADLHRGPRHASVERIAEADSEIESAFAAEFSVTYDE
jgi:acylphosphatase